MIKRILCCLSLSFIFGILYGRDRNGWFLVIFLLLVIFLAAAEAVYAHARKKNIVAYSDMRADDVRCMIIVRCVLCIILFGAGCLHIQEQQKARSQLEKVLTEGDTITVQGKISQKEETAAEKFQQKQFIYYLTDTHVVLDGRSYPSYGILVYSSNGQYQPGNILNVTGAYAPFQISRNEGNFNEKQYRQSRKWEFRVYADSEVLCSDHENKYAIFLGKLREKMQEVFVGSMDPADAGVMADMALGEKSLLDPEIKSLYRDAGISHILAISGLHISILGMGLLSLLQRLGCHRKLSAVLASAVVISFGIFSGMEVSTVRAVGMFVLMMMAQILGYSYDSLTALSLNAALQLWGNPFLTEYAGFLFSYTAVLGVVGVWNVIRKAGKESEVEEKNQKKDKKCGILHSIKGKLWETMCVSASIQLATLPLSVYFYYEIPTYGILVNACILPFMGILLFLGLLGGLLGSVVPGLGTVLLMPAGWLLAFNETVCGISQKLPGANLIVGKPSMVLVLSYYAILGISLYLVCLRKKKCYLAGAAIALFCLLFVRQNPDFEIAVLDVGQGDGIFIQNENGEHFFVDGGSSDVKNLGKYRILPFLKSRGVRSVKGWIVSHADADHINGLQELLQMGYPIEYLVLAEHMVRDEALEALVQQAQKAGCQILYVSPGMKFGSGNIVFTALAPEEDGTDRNASSLVVLLEHLGFTGIFTGDIGEDQELELAEKKSFAQHRMKDVDFYKAAHHGSDYSNSREFLETISPEMTVISCSEKNSYGHPGKEAVERIRESGSHIFLTMEQGQICIWPEEEGIRVWTYLP